MMNPGIEKLMLSAVLSVFALFGSVGKADVIWTAYNDCIREGAGDSTAENATDWTIYSGRTNHTTGKLKDFATGSDVEMPTVTFSMNLTSPVQTHIDYGDNFAPGTPAHDVFDGKIDFGGTIIQHSSLIGWWVEIRFTGLDPVRKYTFVASAVRIEPSDLDRRSLVTIRDADAYTNNSGYHSVGDAAWVGTDTTKFLAVGNATQGIVVRWDDIEPGPDGDFTIRAEANSSAGSHGRRGYALHGFMLQQIGIAGNRQPVVGAGVNQETTLPDNRVGLDGTVADDGRGEPNGFLEFEWSKVSGPGDVTFEPNSFVEKATAILEPLKDGTYVLRLSATDGEFSVSDDVTIMVRESICPTGDLSGNCIVNAEDLGVLADQWLVLPSGSADLDGDNEVRMEDFAYLAVNWGENRQRGSVQVTIEPNEVIPVARWRVGEGDWRLSGYTQGDLTVGPNTVHFSTIAGWDTPANRPIQVNYAETSSTSGKYVQQKGWLNVIITPQEAIDAGAKWRVEGGEWRDSGDPLGDLAVRLHTVEFMPISDWIKPANQTIQVNKNKTSLTSGNYKPLPDAPIVINEFMAVNSYVPFVNNSMNIYTEVYGNDTHPDWIELHSLETEDSIDLEGWYLTNDEDDLTKWRIPGPVSIAPNGYYVLFASGKTQAENPDNYPYVDGDGALHTNFGLGAAGDYLALVKPDGMTIVHEYAPEYPEQRGFVSYGISSSGEVGYLVSPTPGSRVSDRWRGAANSAKYDGAVADTKFSRDRGFYYAQFSVEITCETPGATIRYTIDGSEPTLSHGSTASTPIPIRTTTCLRAAAFKTGWLPTNIDTQSYIFPTDAVKLSQAEVLARGYPTTVAGYPGDYGMDREIYDDPAYRDDMGEAILAIPTLSVATDKDYLFGSSGIYSNPTRIGISWERPVSAEFFDVNGVKEWHANCGMRVQGGASRQPKKGPKHSLSLRFRGGYGPGELEYDLFKGSDVDHFNSLHLRAMYNNSWIHWDSGQRSRGSMIRDQWARDCLLDMGQVSGGQGTYAHLYLNGIYWGVYNVHERPEASHYASYHGGDDHQLDALNSGSAVDGTAASWFSLQNLVANAGAGGITLAEFQQIQQKLDVVNLIDYMIVNHFGANHDWDGHNWRAGGGGVNDMPWRIFAWDTERILEGASADETGTNNSGKPSRLFHNLRNSTEFKLLFADRLHKHFFNDGAMTPANTAARWMKRADELDLAIICESARWGDYRRDVHSYSNGPYLLYTKNAFWLPEQRRLINSYFPGRSTRVFNRYKTGYGLYPSLAAPSFSQHGGWDLNGFALTMTTPATVYYTTDGADPRLPGGVVNTAHAEVYAGGTISLTASTHVRARAKSGSTWSALNEAVFSVGPVLENLRITEIMYHPQNTGDPQDPNEEFIELMNVGTRAINLNLVKFTNGVDFTFPRWGLGVGEYVLVVKNRSAFDAQHPGLSGIIAGEYQGRLDNAGERIELEDALGQTIHNFRYRDGWFAITDGMGFSLTIKDPHGTDPYEWDSKGGWRTSPYTSVIWVYMSRHV